MRTASDPGRVVVLEGIDASGRSTQARLLEQHLRYQGIGVLRTSLATSVSAGDSIRRLRHRRKLDSAALALLYAADIAERLEQIVTPSVRAGLVVVADRWIHTPIARAEARGVDPAWLDDVFSFAPAADAVLYLEVSPETALERRQADPDPYEAGLDLHLASSTRDSYRLFQRRIAASLRRQAMVHAFRVIPGHAPVDEVHGTIRDAVDALLAPRRRRA